MEQVLQVLNHTVVAQDPWIYLTGSMILIRCPQAMTGAEFSCEVEELLFDRRLEDNGTSIPKDIPNKVKFTKIEIKHHQTKMRRYPKHFRTHKLDISSARYPLQNPQQGNYHCLQVEPGVITDLAGTPFPGLRGECQACPGMIWKPLKQRQPPCS